MSRFVAEPVGQRRNTLLLVTIAVAALVVAYVMLPGEEERVAMLERDGRREQSMAMLERRFEAGDRRQTTLFQLFRNYETSGDIDKSRRMLELMVEQSPRDAGLLRQLAQFYKFTQDEPAYVSALEKQLAMRFSEPACRELIGILRRKGDADGELQLLKQCHQSGYRRAEDIVRFGFLQAADGNLEAAAELLRSVDDRRRLRADRERLMLFKALIDIGEAKEAQRRGVRWLRATRDDNLALHLIDTLTEAGRYDLGIELAREVGVAGDAVSLAVGELMLARSEAVAARAYLNGWLEKSPIDNVAIVKRFLSAALEAEDAALAFKAAERYGLSKLGQDSLSELAEALGAEGRRSEFRVVRSHLADDTLKGNPLLAAAVEIERGAAVPARALLSRVDVSELEEWRLALWARLMETTRRRSSAIVPPLPGTGLAPEPQAGEPGPLIRSGKVRVRPPRRTRVRGPGPPPGTTLGPPPLQRPQASPFGGG